jgi:hypothetical protein
MRVEFRLRAAISEEGYAGASMRLIGHRPRDYFERLPKPRKISVIHRIRRAYLRHFPPLAEDCAQEACARLIASDSDLKSAPQPTAAPTAHWYDQLEDALVRYATGLVMRRAVVKDLCAIKGLEPLDTGILDALDDAEDDPSLPRAGVAPYMSLGEQSSLEDRWHWMRVAALLRERLAQQPNVDPLVLQVFDQLCQNADAFERSHPANSDGMPDIIRGESFQINHLPLLKSLQDNYPAAGWDTNKLRLKIADLGRDAARVAEGLAGDGILLFEASRRSRGSSHKGQHDTKNDPHDQAEADPIRGSLS